MAFYSEEQKNTAEVFLASLSDGERRRFFALTETGQNAKFLLWEKTPEAIVALNKALQQQKTSNILQQKTLEEKLAGVDEAIIDRAVDRAVEAMQERLNHAVSNNHLFLIFSQWILRKRNAGELDELFIAMIGDQMIAHPDQVWELFEKHYFTGMFSWWRRGRLMKSLERDPGIQEALRNALLPQMQTASRSFFQGVVSGLLKPETLTAAVIMFFMSLVGTIIFGLFLDFLAG